MSNLIVPVASLDSFFYDKQTTTLTVDISDLGDINIFSPLYDDACDVGFSIKSSYSGEVITFSLVSERKHIVENEVICWTFKPVGHTDKPLTVVVYND